MSRLLPKSLLGQVMLVLAIALLLAQVISAALLFRAAEQRREEAVINAIALRVVIARETPRAERIRLRGEARRAGRALFNDGGRLRLPIERRIDAPAIARDDRINRYEVRLRELLEAQGINAGNLAVTRKRAGDDLFVRERVERFPRIAQPGWERRRLVIAAIERPEFGRWQVVRVPEPERDRGVLGGILVQTLVIFAVLFAAMFFALRRLTRPLAQLTSRLTDFAQRPGETVLIEETGPADMRRLIAAHNAMETRIAALLDEKDVMLGAIGHDLKTPLAALRVRIENVPDDAQRARMADSIEELTSSLDDILNLARVGRATEPAERTDCTALAASLVEEYEDMGEPVSMVDGARVVAAVRVTWLRRALRNLIGNAVRYGGSAQVSVAEEDGKAVFRIEDDGPGIDEERIEGLLKPFARGETSRNRATGGAGLGLTLARAVAELHGGTLTLANRETGGLSAELRLPL
ncbi:sensor histidine kinase [Altererythrobacter sp. GH1-8]|uniref:sensor histidine kinase n=1 Tax=Altererythrobacter sp. GH1-8 TaxID=3349333 RepID=UPI00374DD9E8